jgi:tRNA-dihydrouridine synthase B
MGSPDIFFTDYFRVHVDSVLEKTILRSVDEKPTECPVVALMIGKGLRT